MGALLSFLGGSVFRMLWGEVSAYFTRRQEHAQEMERLEKQSKLEGERFERDMARVKLQADLKVEEVKVVGDLAIQRTEADAFVEAMKGAFKPIGIKWVDAWNGVIRPTAATFALLIWSLKVANQGFTADDFDKELLCAIIGFYFADRALGRRGK